MISDKERREVARRLRELDHSDLQESLICAYLDALAIKGYEDWIGIAHRLADLIEPGPERMCRMVRAIWDDGECVWGCRCTACGDRFTYETGTTWRYCPACGACVIEEES